MEGLSMQNNHLQKDSTEGFCGRIPEGSTEGKKIKYQLNHYSMFRLTLSKQLTSNMVTITLWPHKADSLATFLHWFVCPGPCFSFLICSHLKCAPDDENSNWLFEISACPPKARAGVQWVEKKFPSCFFNVFCGTHMNLHWRKYIITLIEIAATLIPQRKFIGKANLFVNILCFQPVRQALKIQSTFWKICAHPTKARAGVQWAPSCFFHALLSI